MMCGCVRLLSVVLALCIIAICGWQPCFADYSAFEKFTKSGEKAYQLGDFKKALAEFEAATNTAESDRLAVDSLASSLTNRAIVLQAMGRWQGAETLLKRALELLVDGPDPTHRTGVLAATRTLGSNYLQQHKYAEAEPVLHRALTLNEQLYGKEDIKTSESYLDFGKCNEGLQKYDDALSNYSSALSIAENLLGTDHRQTVPALVRLAILYEKQGSADKSKAFTDRALAIARKEQGRNAAEVAATLVDLANFYRDTRKFEQAEPIYKQLLFIRESGGSIPRDVANTYESYARLLNSTGQTAEAQRLEARSLVIRAEEPDDSPLALSWRENNERGMFESTEGRAPEAEKYLKAALQDARQFHSQGLRYVSSLLNLAALYDEQHRYDEARAMYVETLPVLDRIGGPDHQKRLHILYRLTMIASEQRKWDDAERFSLQSIEGLTRRFGAESPEVGTCIYNLAVLYAARHELAVSASFFKQALAIQQKTLGNNDPAVRLTIKQYIPILKALGKDSEAADLQSHFANAE